MSHHVVHSNNLSNGARGSKESIDTTLKPLSNRISNALDDDLNDSGKISKSRLTMQASYVQNLTNIKPIRLNLQKRPKTNEKQTRPLDSKRESNRDRS